MIEEILSVAKAECFLLLQDVDALSNAQQTAIISRGLADLCNQRASVASAANGSDKSSNGSGTFSCSNGRMSATALPWEPCSLPQNPLKACSVEATFAGLSDCNRCGCSHLPLHYAIEHHLWLPSGFSIVCSRAFAGQFRQLCS